MSLLANFIGFQIGWFAAVLGGANNFALAGTLAALAIVLVHLWRVQRPHKEAQLVLAAGVIGFMWDSALVGYGITVYPSGGMIDGLAPFWIVAMWMLFATTLNVSMRWLRGRWILAAVAGAVFGPLAFYGGHKLGGVFFPYTGYSMLVIGIGWAVFMPVLMLLAERLDGTERDRTGREMQYV